MHDLVINDCFTVGNNIFFCDAINRIPGRYSVEENSLFIAPHLAHLADVGTIERFVVGEDKVLALTGEGRYADLFDTVSNNHRIIDLDEPVDGWGNFLTGISDNNSFIILTKSGKVKIIDDVNGDVRTIDVCEKALSGCIQNDDMWIFPEEAGGIYRFSLSDKAYTYIGIETSFHGISNVIGYSDDLYISYNDGTIVKYNIFLPVYFPLNLTVMLYLPIALRPEA